MSDLLQALDLEFVRRALLAGLAASVLCGALGVFVVTKRISFLGDGIAHAAFGGLGLCYFLGVDPRIGAIGVALLCALALGLMGNERLRSHDALIGVLYAAGMAAGVLFLHKTPGYAPNLMSYLFGNLLLVSRVDLWLTVGLTVAALGTLFLLRKGFVAAAFDEVFAFVQGVPVRALFTLLLVLIALAVVVLIQVAGIVLVVALLTIPPLTGRALATTLRGMLVLSIASAVTCTLAGFVAADAYDLPVGPAIIALSTALLVLANATAALRAGRRRRRALQRLG